MEVPLYIVPNGVWLSSRRQDTISIIDFEIDFEVYLAIDVEIDFRIQNRFSKIDYHAKTRFQHAQEHVAFGVPYQRTCDSRFMPMKS